MFNHRGNKEDVKFLEERTGISFLFGTTDKEFMYKKLDFFISKGADVNRISRPSDLGLTPLHAAILFKDSELVKYLLSNGADPLKIELGRGMSSYEFVDFLISNNPKKGTDWDDTRNILMKYRN